MAIPAKHFTVRTLAEHWDCSEKHVRNLIDKRGLPALRIGNLIRIRREDVLSYEQKHIDTPCPVESVTSQSPSLSPSQAVPAFILPGPSTGGPNVYQLARQIAQERKQN